MRCPSYPVDTYLSHLHSIPVSFLFFFFNDTATTEIYTLSLHDALPIFLIPIDSMDWQEEYDQLRREIAAYSPELTRSEEHTSELQSRQYLVCRLLLEKKKIHVSQYSMVAARNTAPITHRCNKEVNTAYA